MPDLQVTTVLLPRSAALVLGTAPLPPAGVPVNGQRDAKRPDPPGDPRHDVTCIPEESS